MHHYHLKYIFLPYLTIFRPYLSKYVYFTIFRPYSTILKTYPGAEPSPTLTKSYSTYQYRQYICCISYGMSISEYIQSILMSYSMLYLLYQTYRDMFCPEARPIWIISYHTIFDPYSIFVPYRVPYHYQSDIVDTSGYAY